MPDKPFFVYFAPGATHAPHHVPKEWADKYKGKFADGWDVQRERTFARQKELGVIPADAELTPRHDEIPAWDDMPDDLKPVLERQMEVYAGFLEHTDHHVGRVIDAHRGPRRPRQHARSTTSSATTGRPPRARSNGAFNEMANFNGMAALETPEFMLSKIDEFGSPSSYNHYAVGWAWAMNTPFQWTKQVASHWGGTRNGTIVHWPNGHHGAGRPALAVHARHRRRADHPRGGRAARADDGQRRAAVADGGHEHAVHVRRRRRPPERHDLQYFEMFGNRGIYHRGLERGHQAPARRGSWPAATLPAFDDDIWELYDGEQRLQPGPRPRGRASGEARTSCSGCG